MEQRKAEGSSESARQTSLEESFGRGFAGPKEVQVSKLSNNLSSGRVYSCSMANQMLYGCYIIRGRLEPDFRQSMVERMYSQYELKKETEMSPCCNSIGNDLARNVVGCVSYDRDGYLLAVVNSGGAIAIYQSWQVRSGSTNRRRGHANEYERDPLPLLCMHTGRRNEAVRWNPLNQNEIGVGSKTDGDVHLFDLTLCKGDKPTRILKYANSAWRNGKPCLQDIQFCSTAPQKIYGATRDGQIQIWDRRSGNFPVACVNQQRDGGRLGCINSISHSLNLLTGAGDHGMLYVWDVRMTSTSSSANTKLRYEPLNARASRAFATQKSSPPSLVASVDINLEIQRVQLQNQEKYAWSRDRSKSPVHSIITDPRSNRHIAFLLASGGTGIVDMEKLEITHIHIPPSMSSSGCFADPEYQESFLGKKRLSWSSTDNVLVSPSPFQVYILLPDKFSDSFRSIELNNLAAAADINPSTSEIVLGTPKNSIITYDI